MTPRRELLRLLGAGTPIIGSGCLFQENTYTQLQDTDEPQQPNTDNSQQTEPDHEFPLPGEPQTGLGDIAIQNTETSLETETDGFTAPDSESSINTDVSINGQASDLSFHTSHTGTGKASGSAAAAYQAAWQATEPGDYKLIAEILPQAQLTLEPGPNDGMASVDKAIQIVDYDHQTPIGNDPVHLNTIKIGAGRGTSELEEFIISTAITMALGKALGLGFVARRILGQIVSAAMDLDYSTGQDHTIQEQFYGDPVEPGWVEAGFSAAEGQVLLFEVAPTVSWGYELEDGDVWGDFYCDTDLVNFSIEEM